MTWGFNSAGNIQPPGLGPNFQYPNNGNAYPFYFNTAFQNVLAAVSNGSLPLNIQVGGASSPGGGNPTLLAALSQGLQLNAVNGISAPVTATGGGGATAFVNANALANVPTIPSPNQYGGN
jgi:hypothetical protein